MQGRPQPAVPLVGRQLSPPRDQQGDGSVSNVGTLCLLHHREECGPKRGVVSGFRVLERRTWVIPETSGTAAKLPIRPEERCPAFAFERTAFVGTEQLVGEHLLPVRASPGIAVFTKDPK